MTKKKIKKKLKKDLISFKKDLDQITHKKKSLKDKKVFKKISKDIQNLNNDLILTKDDKTSQLLYHMLNTPIGAPFVANKTFLEAALNFETQNFSHSDLKHLFSDFSKYEKYFNNELCDIFVSFIDRLKNKN